MLSFGVIGESGSFQPTNRGISIFGDMESNEIHVG